MISPIEAPNHPKPLEGIEMKITVSESLLGGKRSPYRFVAMLDDDAKERGGFGSSERAALWDLARMLDIHPATLTVQASITRIGVR